MVGQRVCCSVPKTLYQTVRHQVTYSDCILLTKRKEGSQMQQNINPKRILVLGIGGAGCNILQQTLAESRVARRYITTEDRQNGNLHGIEPGLEIIFSPSRSLAAQVDERDKELCALLEDYDDVFILAGLGRTTGSKLSLAFAALAKGKGLRIHCFVTLPFAFEGNRRRKLACETLSRLGHFSDSKFVFDNDKEWQSLDSSSAMSDFFAKTEQLVFNYLENLQ